jgi:hypothetical protein
METQLRIVEQLLEEAWIFENILLRLIDDARLAKHLTDELLPAARATRIKLEALRKRIVRAIADA